MSSNVEDIRKRVYESATDLDDAELLAAMAGGENAIEAIAIITKNSPFGTYVLRVGDRPKYVGDDYYEGRAKFPVIKRVMAELQNPSIQFSETEIDIANLDAFYNRYLISGADYFSFIGADMLVKIGLRDVASSFKTIFEGTVEMDGGFDRTRETVNLRARDIFDTLNVSVPLPTVNTTDFPSAPTESLGKVIPMALGDFTAGYNLDAATGTISVSGGGINYDIVTDSPNNFYGGLNGIFVGGGYFVFSIGTYTPDNIIAANIKRGDTIIQCNFNNVPQNTAGYWSIQITTLNISGGGTIPYVYQSGDVAMIAVKIPYSLGNYDNPISQAKEMLKTLAGKVTGDFDATSWNALETKSSPPQSAMTTIKSRVWIGKNDDNVLKSVLGLLAQVRVDMFINNAQLIALSSLHPEDFPDPSVSTKLEQFQINEESVKVKADDRTFFNAALAKYGYTPILDKTQLQTGVRKNQVSIDRSAASKVKEIDIPNLYVASDVMNQLDEFIRFFSAGLEYVDIQTSWAHLRRDMGGFVSVNYSIGGIDLVNKPAQIRGISIDLKTGAIEFHLLSFANFPYANYTPSNSGRMLSSDSATITDA